MTGKCSHPNSLSIAGDTTARFCPDCYNWFPVQASQPQKVQSGVKTGKTRSPVKQGGNTSNIEASDGWIVLPYPPGINAMYKNIPGVGRALTNAAKDWKSDAADILAFYAKLYTEKEVEVDIRFYRGRLRGDADGPVKIVFDALTGTILKDDEQISKYSVVRFLDRERPRAEIRVKERGK